MPTIEPRAEALTRQEGTGFLTMSAMSKILTEIEALPVHSISGYEWECGVCHFHFAHRECWSSGVKADIDGEVDPDERPVDHGELLSRAQVLMIIRDLARWYA